MTWTGDARRHDVRLMLSSVLLVEDDPDLGAMTQEMLSDDYRVDWAPTLGEARRLLGRERYDALVVDRRLPDGDGMDVIRQLRAAGLPTPVLILTALSSLDDIVEGLDGGANDYLTKPFRIAELTARLRAMLRGFRAQSAGLLIGDWLLKPDVGVIEDPDGTTVALTDTETRLLATLAAAPDHVFTRDELLAGVFSAGSDLGAVDVYVSYVRGKTVRAIIDTVRGRGYRIGCPRVV